MSMLSMQIDRLRSCADLYDETTKPEMAKELQRPYLAQELREAVDTIWELRDDLQRAHRENTELRELVRIAIEYCVNGYCAEEDECPLYESRHSCRLYAKARELGVETD